MINSQNMTAVCDDAVPEDVTPEQVHAARRTVAAQALLAHPNDRAAAIAEIRDHLEMLGIAPDSEQSLRTSLSVGAVHPRSHR